MSTQSLNPARPPSSTVPLSTGFAGLAAFLATVVLLTMADLPLAVGTAVCLAAPAAAMAAWAVLVEKAHRRESTGLDWSRPRPLRETLDTSLVKLIGLGTTWAVIGLLFWLIPAFRGPAYLYPTLLAGALGPVLFLVSIPYVVLVDRHMVRPRDGLWHMGRLVCGGWRDADRALLADYARGWAIKAFFLAFLLGAAPAMVRHGLPNAAAFDDAASFWLWAIKFTFLVDVAFGTLGYMLALRVLDSHIRSANPYLSAWVAALLCYPPFNASREGGLLDWNGDHQAWTRWFEGSEAGLALWGAALVSLAALYAWATLVFGLRFSNLTQRGLISTGPYAWLKHPDYASKNVYWWMCALPFLAAGGPADAARNCAMLAGINLLYFWRAKTEERHLRADPDYRAYETWMAEHGAGAVLARRLRALRRPRPAAGALTT